jgi:hypothetical protein
MTIEAVCIRCGEAKGDAWAVCPACNWKPESREDVARSVYLSEHRRGLDEVDVPDLVDAQQRVKDGRITYPQDVIEDLVLIQQGLNEIPYWRLTLMAFYPLLFWLAGLAVVFAGLIGLVFVVKWAMKAAGWI